MQQPTYILDFDSTLVTVESLDELARLSLVNHAQKYQIMQHLEHITHRGMTGEITFDESLQSRLRLFAATKEDIAQLSDYLFTRISPSALAARDWFKQSRNHLYIVSGGFEEYILPVAEKLGLRSDHVFANRFEYLDNTVVGFDETRPTSQQGGKAAQLTALHLPHPLIAIGDGFTDYENKAKGLADEFWAFTETVDRPNVTAKADRVVSSFDEIMNSVPVCV